ncbi:hypothetical protein SAMN05421788_110152 [Filimonas lacunae]|uniref:Uncharacterized protein n=1 Tax=Filimonas lacunae TaxID=477680 RepID=A0A1N7R8C0_9BACT|nr:hypothetical protein [Filimonas lacunae]SIT31386.1 hypothetical protein SAMN05421788_110152 [Filimonas lacunae]
MARNPKYVKDGILSGKIKTWEEIFDLYSISWLALDGGFRNATLRKKSRDTAEFNAKETLRLAQLFGMTYGQLHKFNLKCTNNKEYLK